MSSGNSTYLYGKWSSYKRLTYVYIYMCVCIYIYTLKTIAILHTVAVAMLRG